MAEYTQTGLPGHEVAEAPVRPIVFVGVLLAVTVAIVLTVCIAFFRFFSAQPAEPTNPMASAASQIPPEPRLQDHPLAEIEDLRAYETEVLSSYGWVDRKAGIIRIPIERAFLLQLQRGFPTRKAPNAGSKEGTKK
jgi:hypothetical protein